jgi:hypothetical protein
VISTVFTQPYIRFTRTKGAFVTSATARAGVAGQSGGWGLPHNVRALGDGAGSQGCPAVGWTQANSQELIPHKRKRCCARLPLMPLILILVILLLLFGGGGYYMGPGLGYYGGGGLSLVLLLVILYLLFGRGRRL